MKINLLRAWCRWTALSVGVGLACAYLLVMRPAQLLEAAPGISYLRLSPDAAGIFLHALGFAFAGLAAYFLLASPSRAAVGCCAGVLAGAGALPSPHPHPAPLD